MAIPPHSGFALIRLTDYLDVRSGRLGAGALRAAISAALASGQIHLAVDIGSVTLMDAEALGELATSFSRLARLGGRLALVEPQERVKRLLSVTRLDTVLPLLSRDDASAAVGAFRKFRSPRETPGWPVVGVC